MQMIDPQEFGELRAEVRAVVKAIEDHKDDISTLSKRVNKLENGYFRINLIVLGAFTLINIVIDLIPKLQNIQTMVPP